LIQYFQ